MHILCSANGSLKVENWYLSYFMKSVLCYRPTVLFLLMWFSCGGEIDD